MNIYMSVIRIVKTMSHFALIFLFPHALWTISNHAGTHVH